jgi:hypothetical protein
MSCRREESVQLRVTNNTPHSGLFSLDLPVLQADTIQKLAARLARLERGVKGNPRGSLTVPGCLSRIQDPNFFHPGSKVEKVPDPGSASASINLSTIPTKKIVSALSDPNFFHPASRDQKGTESRIRNTVFLITSEESDIETFNSASDPASFLC